MADDMLSVDIDTSEINRLLKEFPEYENIILQEAQVATQSSLFMFQELIKGGTPVGVTGHLRSSFDVTNAVIRGRSVEGSVSTSITHGLPIERGRTPGRKMPPVSAIEIWVRRKLGITENSRGVAYIIAKRIGERGFATYPQGARMVEKAFNEGSPKAIRLFDLATQEAVHKIEREIVN